MSGTGTVSMRTQAGITLPEGYSFEQSTRVIPQERAGLMKSADWNTSSPKQSVSDIHYRSKGISMIDVGVRGEDDELVGFGRIYYLGENGEFCDFVVNPTHQRRGIGRAIIDERLRRAESAGIASIYIPPLEKRNTLASYYEQKGFHKTLLGELVKGPYPVSVTSPAG